VRPVCPPTAPAGETVVRVTGLVDIDGRVADLSQEPHETGAAPPDLVEAVTEAVGQWIFTPTLLNGQPVEVGFTVTVTFRKV
jgi:hypothetical protein